MMRTSSKADGINDVTKTPEDDNPALHGSVERKENGESAQPSKNFATVFTDERKPDTNKKSTKKSSATMRRAKVFHLIGLPWGILTVIFGVYYGLYTGIPQIYLGWADWWVSLIRGIFWFMIIELLINWYFLRTVTSYFSPSMCPADDMRRSCEESDRLAREIYNPMNKKVPEHREESLGERSVKYKDQRYVTVLLPGENGKTRYMMYPYYTWRPCLACNVYRPPRAHHCPLCRRCVLKRDHHCFFSGSCVGLHNQRFFIVFTFWALLLTSFAAFHATLYVTMVIWDELSIWDFFFPATILRYLTGFQDFNKTVWMFIYSSFLFMVPTSFTFFWNQCELITIGLTSYEKEEDMKIIDTRSTEDKFRGALGDNWGLSFLIPLHKIYPAKDDGIHWPTVKGVST